MRLRDKYKKEIAPQLIKDLKLDNVMEAPQISKVTLNVGFGRHNKDKAYIEAVQSALTRISGQKPVLTKARQSISSFKIREGMIIGASVTIRGQRMYDFVEKLINATYPRVRDFRGITKKHVDRTGNMTVGFKEHLAFPEIRAEEVDNVFGLEVCLTTSAKTKEEGLRLFELFGFPFKKDNK
jgi:large subunit ribosomal protein L5